MNKKENVSYITPNWSEYRNHIQKQRAMFDAILDRHDREIDETSNLLQVFADSETLWRAGYLDIHSTCCVVVDCSVSSRQHLANLLRLIRRAGWRITYRTGFLDAANKLRGGSTDASLSLEKTSAATGDVICAHICITRTSCRRVEVGTKVVPVYEIQCE